MSFDEADFGFFDIDSLVKLYQEFLVIQDADEAHATGLKDGALFIDQGVDFDPVFEDGEEALLAEEETEFDVEAVEVGQKGDELADPLMVLFGGEDFFLGEGVVAEFQQFGC